MRAHTLPVDIIQKVYYNKLKEGVFMANNNKELAAYVMEQLSELGNVRNIPMMGGYVFYYKERIFGGISGNGLMVKITEASKKYMPDSEPKPPYDNAKPMLPVTILEDKRLFQQMIDEMYQELPERKVKKRSEKKI